MFFDFVYVLNCYKENIYTYVQLGKKIKYFVTIINFYLFYFSNCS